MLKQVRSTAERFKQFFKKRILKNPKYRSWFFKQLEEDTILISFFVLLACMGLIGLILLVFPSTRDQYFEGIVVEFTGMLFDIIIFGIAIATYERIMRRRNEYRKHLEIIDDFKKWQSDEAYYRIAGAIKRINRMGITAIDFGGWTPKGFNFAGLDVRNITGSTFFTGLKKDQFSKNSTFLEAVSFQEIIARDCIFSNGEEPHDFWGFVGSDLSFHNADLTGSSFDGASLFWNKIIEDESSWYNEWEYPKDGNPARIPKYIPAFSATNLENVSFRNVKFLKADFRYANNIEKADFTGAKGLETCLFDEGVKEDILRRFNIQLPEEK